ncbi:hypothetical protein BT69DRAFT_1350498 [Atractiella rhizophila]|nr:hypothetical protein BT69DRAFT_1350498 [Atractiella rhizophila]
MVHRHSTVVEQCYKLLKIFTTHPLPPEHVEELADDVPGVPKDEIDELELQGWDYQGLADGKVRTYTRRRADREEAAADFQYYHLNEEHREHDMMPWVRGDGWIEGDWKIADVVATIRSYDARSTFDTRLDCPNCKVKEILNETDNIVHMHYHAIFPVAARDGVIVLSEEVHPEQSLAYIIARSVDDGLIPPDPSTYRMATHMIGWAIRKLPHPPEYDALARRKEASCRRSSQPAPSHPSSSNVRAPSFSHTSQLSDKRHSSSSSYNRPVMPSRSSGSSSSFQSLRPPAQTPTSHRSSTNSSRPSSLRSMGILPSLKSRPSAFGNRASSFSTQPRPPAFLGAPLARSQTTQIPASTHHSSFSSSSPLPPISRSDSPVSDTSSEEDLPPKAPGFQTTYLTRLDPGSTNPNSFQRELFMRQSVIISQMNLFFQKYGFAPYLQRENRKHGLDLIDQIFAPLKETYSAVYRCHEEVAGETTKIRFFGSTFGNGNFTIRVVRATDWHVEFDNPPENVQLDQPAQPTIDEEGFYLQSSMTFENRSQSSLPDSLTHTPDSNKKHPGLPGSLGPCTLVVKNTVIGVPIQIVIERTKEKKSKSKKPNGRTGKRAMSAKQLELQLISDGPQPSTISRTGSVSEVSITHARSSSVYHCSTKSQLPPETAVHIDLTTPSAQSAAPPLHPASVPSARARNLHPLLNHRSALYRHYPGSCWDQLLLQL